MTTETSLEFVEAITFPEDSCVTITLEAADYRRLLKLAKTAALIEEHHIVPTYHENAHAQWWEGKTFGKSICEEYGEGDKLHEAVRAVAERDAALKDAERYRWLREHSTQPSEPWSTHSNPESLDQEIDAAIVARRMK